MMKEKVLSFRERVFRDSSREGMFRWAHMHMPRGPARRAHIREVILRYGYLLVNRKYVLSTNDPDIKYMLKKNIVKTKRVYNTGPTCRETRLVLADPPKLPVYT